MFVDGHHLPSPKAAWGSFFEETFFHTSRYFQLLLFDLEKQAEEHYPDLRDFNARELNNCQRLALSWMLASPFDRQHVRQVLDMLHHFHRLNSR